MDITELTSFNMSDAIAFHDELNPKLWVDDELNPEVREQLLVIAKDFVSSLGIKDLHIVDITVSGSNAAYSYTPHSDLDLHVVVDMAKLPNDEVYRELFTAKKTLYNDSHTITVRDIPVELYVQDSNEPVKSLGEYSVLHDKWIHIPKKRRANYDEVATRAKFDNLAELVELALTTADLDRIEKTIDTIKRYRKAGLARGGEFGPENLAFKAIRKQGGIQELYDLRNKLRSKKLSIDEDTGSIADVIKSSLGLKQFIVTEKGSDLYLDSIIVDKKDQNRGLGTKALKQLIAYADQTGKRIILTPGLPNKEHGTTSRNRLVKFYKKFGFKENTGRSIDFAMGAGKMYRDPKNNLQEREHNALNKPTLTVAEIATKHGVTRMQVAQQLDKGIKVELEHTTEKSVAREIALDHLAEDPKYYTKLAKAKLESTTSMNPFYMHEGEHYSTDMLLEQALYEDFLGSAKQYLGNRYTQKMSDIKGQVSDFLNAGIIIKDVLSNDQLMNNVTSQIRKWTSQLVKDVNRTIGEIGDKIGSPQLAQKLNAVWNFIVSKVTEFGRSPGWKGFLGSLGIYGFVKFISEMVRNLNTLKSTLASGAIDALVGKAKELGTSLVGNITMPGFFGLFDKLTTVKQYFLDVLNQVKAKFGSIAVAGTPQFSKGVQLEASGYIPSYKQRKDPRFKTALTVDVKPNAIKKNAKAFGFKTSRGGIPPQARADGKITETLMNEWKAFLADDRPVIEWKFKKCTLPPAILREYFDQEAKNRWNDYRIPIVGHMGDNLAWLERVDENEASTKIKELIEFQNSIARYDQRSKIKPTVGGKISIIQSRPHTAEKIIELRGFLTPKTISHIEIKEDHIAWLEFEDGSSFPDKTLYNMGHGNDFERMVTLIFPNRKSAEETLSFIYLQKPEGWEIGKASLGETATSRTDEYLFGKRNLKEDQEQQELFPGYNEKHRQERLNAWLGKSHAMAGKKPKVLYHATTKNFDQFRVHNQGWVSGSFFGNTQVDRTGIFLAENPKFAEEFIKNNGTGPEWKENAVIIPVYLSAQYPFSLLDDSLSPMLSDEATVQEFKEHDIDLWSIYQHFYEDKRWELFDGPEGEEFVRNLKSLGYDSAVMREEAHSHGGSEVVWVAFEPSQVKAITNRGSFSPDDPRMMRENLDSFILSGSKLMKKYDGTKMKYKDLPVPAQEALTQWMIREGENIHYRRGSYGYVEVPTADIIELLDAQVGNSNQFEGPLSFKPSYRRDSVWPVIWGKFGFEDGWHRVERYIKIGLKTIPVVVIY